MTKRLTKQRKQLKQMRRRARLEKHKKTELLNKNLAYLLEGMKQLNVNDKDIKNNEKSYNDVCRILNQFIL